MKQLSDEDIMILVAHGNIDMAQHLFDRYHISIFNYVFMMTKNREASQDITQDVFYRMIKYRQAYKKKSFSSWIYSIARNRCHSFFEHLKKKDQRLDEVEFKLEVGDHITNADEIEQLRSAVNKLPKEEKELIVLSRFQGMKYREISEITGYSIGNIKIKIHRAMQKLRTFYFQNNSL